jgi:hypothetical protein
MTALRRSLAVLLVAGAALAARPPAASAAPSQSAIAEAKRRFTRGNQLYADGRYEEALRLYLAAYELVHSVDLLYNIALAREKILDHENCAIAFRQYLAEAGEKDPLRERAEDGFRRCRDRTMIPVKVSSAPEGAAISVGQSGEGMFRGRTPRDLRLAPGTYTITVTLPGYAPMKQEVVVDIGGRPEVDFPLERLSTLAIEADVRGAQVAIDDAAPEPAPVKREVRAGLYRIRVAKSGHETVEREVRVAPGEQSTLLISLPALTPRRRVTFRANVPADVIAGGRRLGTTPIAGELPAGSGAVEVRARSRIPYADSINVPADRDIVIDVELARPRSRFERWLFWGLAGAAGAAAIGAGTFGVLALSDQSDFDDRPSVAGADSGESHARRADILWGTSIAFAAAAAVTWFATARSSGATVR